MIVIRDIQIRQEVPRGVPQVFTKEPVSAVEWSGPQPHYAYASRDGARVAWFSCIGEFAMGSPQYELRVGPAGAAVGTLPPAAWFRGLSGGRGNLRLNCPQPASYQPWAHDNRALLLSTWDGRSVLFDPDHGEARLLQVRGLAESASCSPTRPVAFVVTGRWPRFGLQGRLVPLEGKDPPRPVLVLRWQCSAHWLADGRHLLVLYQGKGAPRLQLWLADETRLLAETPLDPLGLVPPAPYPMPPRRSELEFVQDNRLKGYLSASGGWLDHWEDPTYLPGERRLLVSILRPVGEAKRVPQIGQVIPVAKRWVELTLDFGEAA